MAHFTIDIFEVREYTVRMEVEAPTLAEAKEMALNGESTSEEDVQLIGVVNRTLRGED